MSKWVMFTKQDRSEGKRLRLFPANERSVSFLNYERD